MNVIICDDERMVLTSIEQKVMQWAQKNGHSNGIVVHTFTSTEDLLDAWEHGLQIDVVFLDIQVPGELSGLAVAKEIHSNNEYIPIVFITSYGEYAEEGYVVNALRYLRKPVSERAIAECMDILWRRWELQHRECVMIELPTQVLRLPVQSILYAEVSGHYCMIKTTDSEQIYKLKLPLDTIRKKLPVHLFVQCHRSLIVNLMYIRHITNTNLTMADGTQVQIGRMYQPQLMKQFRLYYLGGQRDADDHI